MSAWQDLAAELALWQEAGRTARFWWRDDDAVGVTPALRRLTAVAMKQRAPLALAVIPAGLEAELPEFLESADAAVTVLQHGFAHRNHAPGAQKKMELGDHRALATIGGELRQGRTTLARSFASRFLPVMVPPWNRISGSVVDALPAWGYHGLSTYGPRPAAQPRPGLAQINCHLDLMAWKPQRRFLGTDALCGQLTALLRKRRETAGDGDEPLGILSHHLVQDAAAWRFLEELLRNLGQHPAARLLSCDSFFAE